MSVVATLAPPAPFAAPDPVRVMIVDDAVVVRGLVSRWIDGGLLVVIDIEAALDHAAMSEPGRSASSLTMRGTVS